jgi:hypothetical protein
MADYDNDIPEDESDRGAMTPEQQANSNSMKPKPRVVSKAELDKSGLSLRDFLNKEQGLTRRGGAPAAPAVPAKVTDTGDEVARMAARAPKPPLRQVTMRDNAESYVAKQAARKAEDAAADAASDKTRQSRIITGMQKNPAQNKFMGSTGLKSGGSVSSASKRADGCCTKGKTKGKYL